MGIRKSHGKHKKSTWRTAAIAVKRDEAERKGREARTGALTGMAKARGFDVLVATDGSPGDRAAVTTTTAFPWPRGTWAHAVVASRDLVGAPGQTESGLSFWAGVDRAARLISRAAQRQLAARWPDAEVTVVDQPATAAILSAARRAGSDVIVVGSHGHGVLGRLVLGSASRAVVRQANGPVLVVKGRPRPIRRLMLGVDGSVQARRAVRFLCQLAPPPKARVTVVRVGRAGSHAVDAARPSVGPGGDH